ncbi:hypothetical protein ACFWY9_37720 [Amycolatopsis sp. NPDC059027]|uniref:hypothetical protein n=1 Tax=Amycolatopsis sp. NPDC059027 TaxID=3346709 RepID=UPI00366C3AE7
MTTHDTHDRFDPNEWDGEITFQAVTAEQAPAVVAAYRAAVAMAEALRESMNRAGLSDPALTLVPTLREDGTPVVVVTLTAGAVRRIDALLSSGTPPPGRTDAA